MLIIKFILEVEQFKYFESLLQKQAQLKIGMVYIFLSRVNIMNYNLYTRNILRYIPQQYTVYIQFYLTCDRKYYRSLW